MSRIVELPVPHDLGDLLMKGELTPDFRIFTAAGEPSEESEQGGRPIVRMIGSSTEKDLQGDTMTVNALADMCKIRPNLSVFLNHEYDLPDKLFGSIIESPTLVQRDGIADLHLTVEVEMDNPKAAKTYQYIKNGRLLGCSVGCMVTKYEIADEDDGDNYFFMPLTIHGVYVVEFSVVSIPANQRSWVENALKGAFARTFDPALAPAMKSLWPREFSALVRTLDGHNPLRRELEDAPVRPGGHQRLDWEPKSKSFIFTQRGKSTVLDIPQVTELLHKSAAAGALVQAAQQPNVNKTVSGKTSWPLMGLSTEWTGSKAEQQIFAWAENDEGEITASKARQCFLYCDPDKSDKRSGYKMPFCYVEGDEPKIVPLGVRACANVLAGGMGGVSASDEDKEGMKRKVKTMYGRINRELKPDPEWVVPWEKEDSASVDIIKVNGEYYAKQEDGTLVPWTSKASVEVGEDGSHEPFVGTHTHKHKTYGYEEGDEQNMHAHEHSHDGDANHSHDHEDRQKAHEHAENADGTQGIALKAGGNHEKMTGKHRHKHAAFGSDNADEDGLHSHMHEHNDDADHRHSHDDDGKQENDEEKAYAENADGTQGIALKANGDHEPMTGKHRHKHRAYGQEDADNDGMHAHEHSHNNDADHRHMHEEEKAFGDAEKLLLASYNSLGNSLGLPTISEADVRSKSHPALTRRKEADMQAVVTCVSAIDQLADALDAKVDYLMCELGIPDYDSDSPSGGDDGSYPMRTVYGRALERFVKLSVRMTKEGREFSEDNMKSLQLLHDTVALMTDNKVCGLRGNGNGDTPGGLDYQEAQDAANEAMGRRNLQEMARQIESLKGVFGEFGTLLKNAFPNLEAAKELDGKIAEAQATLVGIKRQITNAYDEVQRATETIRRLKDMPLGPPTSHKRTVQPQSDPVGSVTYQELAAIEKSASAPVSAQQTADEAFALTYERSERLRDGSTLLVRVWPESAMNRPPLTSAQRAMMTPDELLRYTRGMEVAVPVMPNETRHSPTRVNAE